MSLGENIKKYRKEKGLTQKALGEKINVGYRSIQQYEGNINTPPVNKLKAIAEILDVSTDVLLAEEKNKYTINNYLDEVYTEKLMGDGNISELVKLDKAVATITHERDRYKQTLEDVVKLITENLKNQ